MISVCGIRLCTEDTSFYLTEAIIGLVADMGVLHIRDCLHCPFLFNKGSGRDGGPFRRTLCCSFRNMSGRSWGPSSTKRKPDFNAE